MVFEAFEVIRSKSPKVVTKSAHCMHRNLDINFVSKLALTYLSYIKNDVSYSEKYATNFMPHFVRLPIKYHVAEHAQSQQMQIK